MNKLVALTVPSMLAILIPACHEYRTVTIPPPVGIETQSQSGREVSAEIDEEDALEEVTAPAEVGELPPEHIPLPQDSEDSVPSVDNSGYIATPEVIDTIAIAVLNYHLKTGLPKDFPADGPISLTICNKQPSARFMSKFDAQNHPVINADDERSDDDNTFECRINEIIMNGPDKADVEMGCYYKNNDGKGFTFSMSKENGLWVVTDTQTNWLSDN